MRAIWLVLCAVVVVAVSGAAMGGAPAAAQDVPAFDNLLPDNTVFYASVRNLPDATAKVKLTGGYKIFEQLNLIERLAPPDKYAELQKLYGTFIEPLGAICRGEVAVAAMDFELEAGGAPKLVVLIDVRESENAFNDYLEKTIFPLLDEQGIKPETQEAAGVKVTKIALAPADGKEVFYAVKDGVLMISPRFDTLSDVLANTGPGPAKAMLPSNTLYANVKKSVGPADLMVYVNFGAYLQKALEEDEEAAAMLGEFGFDKLRAVGLGTKIGADGSGTTVLRLATEGEPSGWLGMVARAGGPFKSLKRMPASTGFYAAVNAGSIEELYKQFMQIIQKLSETSGGMDFDDFAQGIEAFEEALGMSLEDDVLPAFGCPRRSASRPWRS